MFERLLCPKADVKLYRNGMISRAAFGHKQWDGLLLNLTASQCARLDCVFVKRIITVTGREGVRYEA